MKKLILATPQPSLVDGYLCEIAKGYGIEWDPPDYTSDHGSDGDQDDGGLNVSLA